MEFKENENTPEYKKAWSREVQARRDKKRFYKQWHWEQAQNYRKHIGLDRKKDEHGKE